VGPDHDSPQPRATTLYQQQRQTPPHGRVRAATCPEKVICSKTSTVSPDPHGKVSDPWIYNLDLQVWSRTPTCKDRTPPRMGSGPPTVGSQGSRTEHTRALIRAQAGVRCQHVSRPGLVGSGPNRIHSCSPLRWRPNAATWHTTHGISQWAEPGMTPQGYARLRIHYG
jgi:hypothetical protein